MSTTTTNLGLVKPTLTDDHKVTIGTDLPANFDILDASVPLYGMARQAIIDGNFQIAQAVPTPGTQVTDTADGKYPVFDLWKTYGAGGGGYMPTIKWQQRTLTPGEVDKSAYCLSINVDGAGTGLGQASYYQLEYFIEHGVRYLCGAGKEVTLSFYARSTISNKKLGIYLLQNYGTGGSPSASEIVVSSNSCITLTSAWQRFNIPFTMNTLNGKTFGTNNNDVVQVEIWPMWGSGFASRFGVVNAETFVGAGDIEIAQVQLNAGDVALPFEPKSFADELRACQRYYEKSYGYSTKPGTSGAYGDMDSFIASNLGYTNNTKAAQFTVEKRAIPSLGFYSPATGNGGYLMEVSPGNDVPIGAGSWLVYGSGSTKVIRLQNMTGGTKDVECWLHWTADARF